MKWWAWARDQEHVSRVNLLEQVPLFAGLRRHLLSKLLVKLFEKEYQAGETIFREGEPGKALYIILEGTVRISRATEQGETPVATLTTGASFGELALIDALPRSASAIAETPARLLILYKSHFDDLIDTHNRIATTVMANLLRTLSGYIRAIGTQAPGDRGTAQ